MAAKRFKTLVEMTKFVVDEINKQGTYAGNPKFGTCHYLTDDGRKCAVGVLLEDGLKTTIREPASRFSGTVSELCEILPYGASDIAIVDDTSPLLVLGELKRLQSAHDTAFRDAVSLNKDFLSEFNKRVNNG